MLLIVNSLQAHRSVEENPPRSARLCAHGFHFKLTPWYMPRGHCQLVLYSQCLYLKCTCFMQFLVRRKAGIISDYCETAVDTYGIALRTGTLLDILLPNKEKVIRAISQPGDCCQSNIRRQRRVCIISGRVLFMERQVPWSLPGSWERMWAATQVIDGMV